MIREARPIDRMEMLVLLGKIYAQTAVGYRSLSVARFIRENAGPTVRTRYVLLTKTLQEMGLLLKGERCGYGHKYHWNSEDYGPPTLPLTEVIIAEMTRINRKEAREWYHRKKIIVNNL